MSAILRLIFRPLAPCELEGFVLKCLNILPKWNMSSEVFWREQFVFCLSILLAADFQASQTRWFCPRRDKRKQHIPVLFYHTSMPRCGRSVIACVTYVSSTKRCQMVWAGWLRASSFLPTSNYSIFHLQFLPLHLSFFVSSMISSFQTFILYIDISVSASTGCKKKKKEAITDSFKKKKNVAQTNFPARCKLLYAYTRL